MTNKEELINTAELYELPVGDEIVLLDDAYPDTVAAAYEEQSPVSHHYNSIDGWSIYSDDKYQQVRDEKEMEVYLRRFIERCKIGIKKDDKFRLERLKQTGGFIRDVMNALRALHTVHIKPSKKAICSFSGSMDPETTIAVKNGLLDLSDMSKPVLKPFTRDFYTFNYLPVDYDPGKTAPVWSDKLLAYYFHDKSTGQPDTIASDVLHSWIKRWLLRVTEPHRICALIGRRRSGKSTIGRVVCNLLGQQNVSAITIASLAGNHGLYGLMNKQLGIMWDASVTGRQGDIGKAVEIMKNISGQDNITVNPKNKDVIDLQSLRMNIFMIANKVADLKDSTGALASRFTFLHTTQSFFGHEDPSIEAYVMENELPGILNLVLAAPSTIVEHPGSASLLDEFIEMSSPYTAFANECCSMEDPTSIIPTDLLWAYYKDWCIEYNQKVLPAHTFKVEFSSSLSGIEKARPRLTQEEISGLNVEHCLDQRPGSRLKISDRPYCFTGIDIDESRKGVWSQGNWSNRYGPGPEGEDRYGPE